MRKEVAVLGWGDVGKAIGEIVAAAGNNLLVKDPAKSLSFGPPGILDVLHICFPWSPDFNETVIKEIKENLPDLTIIESTVPVGTTDLIATISGRRVVHSFVRGLHFELSKSLRTFQKYIGGEAESARQAINYYSELGLRPYHLGSAETTELAKLLSTAYFGWSLLFAKAAKHYADQFGVDYKDVYSHPGITYNEGYLSLGHPEFVRPILRPPDGKIGGKCVSQNIDLMTSTTFQDVFKILNDEGIFDDTIVIQKAIDGR